MKINWGLKIAILYLSFVALIVVLVFKSMNQKVDLVSPDYYAQELAFQDKINAQKNANQLKQSIDYTVNGKSITLLYSSELKDKGLKGEVLFFRPSDSGQDLKFNLNIGSGNSQTITSTSFVKGLYKMQLSWEMEGLKYYKEESIFLN